MSPSIFKSLNQNLPHIITLLWKVPELPLEDCRASNLLIPYVRGPQETMERTLLDKSSRDGYCIHVCAVFQQGSKEEWPSC